MRALHCVLLYAPKNVDRGAGKSRETLVGLGKRPGRTIIHLEFSCARLFHIRYYIDVPLLLEFLNFYFLKNGSSRNY